MRVAKDALLFGDGRKGERGGGTGGIEVQEDVDEGEAIGEEVSFGLIGGVMTLKSV